MPVNESKKKLYGYTGNVLRVNLGTGKIDIDPLDEKLRLRYLGGSGFISYLLWKELDAGIDPLGDKNKLIFATGPVTGVSFMGSARHGVGAKSPQTGGIALSQVGEYWGTELKRAGFDMVIIEEKAANPVYLSIKDGHVEIKDASGIWGKETRETQKAIRQELGDEKTRISMIGPGGENLVKYACIMSGLFEASGRGGLGAVMGSKKLKAIAVRGTGKISVAHPEKLGELRKQVNKQIDETYILSGWKRAGTGFDMDAGVMSGDVPIRNWRDGEFPTVDNISGTTLMNTIGDGMDGCFACPIRCKKRAKFDEPYSVDPDYGGPEYEALGALGSNLGIDNLKAVVKGNEKCNAGAVDVISAGGVIAFCMEATERGLLTKEQTDGIDMTWGNSEAMLACIDKIIHRDGFGNILAEGINQVAKWVGKGSEEFAIHVKGVDPGMHEPRLMPSMGLGFMINPHGADHCLNVHDMRFSMEERMKSMNPLGFHDPIAEAEIGPRKVAVFRVEHLRQGLMDCMVLCHLSSAMMDLSVLVELLDAVTDWGTREMELLRIEERVLTVSRLFNVREGLTSEDDVLPKRFFEPKTSGALSNRALDPKAMDRAKRYYYRLMGWDENGIPWGEKVEELYIE